MILAETRHVCWRVDPGPKFSSWGPPYDPDGSGSINGYVPTSGPSRPPGIGTTGQPRGPYTNLIWDPKITTNVGEYPCAPYAGSVINDNAMQITSSVDIFGTELVFESSTVVVDGVETVTNVPVGKKWIIQPKWETPMMNFNDKFGTHPVTASLSTKTLPAWGVDATPNGMWHQFGTLPASSDTGIFLEIHDMPNNWLQNHYEVRTTGSVYNDYSADLSGTLATPGIVKSLKDLCVFETNSRRLGQLKDSLTVKEAIVAVPYVINPEETGATSFDFVESPEGKLLFRLPYRSTGATIEELGGHTLWRFTRPCRPIDSTPDRFDATICISATI